MKYDAGYRPSVRKRTSDCIALYLENKAARDIVIVQHITLNNDLLIPSREILLFRHVNTDQSGSVEFLLAGLRSWFLSLFLPDSLVDSLLGLVGGLFSHLSSLLRSILRGLSLRSVLIGGGLAAIRKGLLRRRISKDRGIGGILRSHDEAEQHERQKREGTIKRREGWREEAKDENAPLQKVGWDESEILHRLGPGRTFRTPQFRLSSSQQQLHFFWLTASLLLGFFIMAGIFEAPRNADTLCEFPLRLHSVPPANLLAQSWVGRKSLALMFESRTVREAILHWHAHSQLMSV